VAMKFLKTTEGIYRAKAIPGCDLTDSAVLLGARKPCEWRLVTGAGLRSDFEGAEHLSIYSAQVPTFGGLLA